MIKKGQIAIFTILAIFFVGAIGIFYFLSNNPDVGKLPESDEVHNLVKRYIENIVYGCIEKIGKQGGYDNIPFNLVINNTAYWYKNRIVLQPALEDIESQIERCSENLLKNTTNIVRAYFADGDIQINGKRIDVSTSINGGVVSTQIFYPLVVRGESSAAIISDFNIVFSVGLKELYDEATNLLHNVVLPEFDICNPQKYVEDGLNFTFFVDGDNLLLKGQEITLFENGTRKPYELIFAVNRPIKEAFGLNKKRLAVLYQDNADLPTFGWKTLEVVNQEIDLKDFDSYACEQIPEFINQINNYDVIIITGNLQFQIIQYIQGTNPDYGNLLYGCNQFNKKERKETLKNWVNNGGVLWINDVSKHESDDFITSYLGFLGYQGGQWEPLPLGSLFDMKSFLVEQIQNRKEIISNNEVSNHVILQCPHDISKEIAGTWFNRELRVTSQDEVIIGNRNEAKLWIRNIGKGFVIFDEFLLKDNLYEETGFDDDLYSKGLVGKYFVNVLTYLAKHTKPSENLVISLLSPANDAVITLPYFEFYSLLGNGTSYSLQLINISGKTFDIKLTSDLLKYQDNVFKANLSVAYSDDWDFLIDGLYEWKITGRENNNLHISNIGFFTKNSSYVNVLL